VWINTFCVDILVVFKKRFWSYVLFETGSGEKVNICGRIKSGQKKVVATTPGRKTTNSIFLKRPIEASKSLALKRPGLKNAWPQKCLA
jgi:hypothetical protein